jgi:predicted MFS family arabinose efflux permease
MTHLHVTSEQVSRLPTLTLMGYAFGMLLINPLGDRYNRRHVILLKSLALVVALFLTGIATSLTFLMLASLLMGLTATLAQDVIPAAAQLGPEQKRGEIIGIMMAGLLSGVLLSRVLSGLIAELAGWRMVFFSAAALGAVLTLLLFIMLPGSKPTTTLPYRHLMVSIGQLLVRHATVRHAAMAQGLLAVAFSSFWTTLSLMLQDSPMHLGSGVAGAFGLAGVSGALLAPKLGKIADKAGPLPVVRLGATLTFIGFPLMLLCHLFCGDFRVELVCLVLLTIVFDLGFQMAMISHQAIIYRSAPEALSRINSILLVGMFTGMSVGSYLAGHVYAVWHWTGVMGLASVCSGLAVMIRMYFGIPEPRNNMSSVAE